MKLKSSFKRGLAIAATVGLIGIGVAVGASSASAADRVQGPLVMSPTQVSTTYAFISEGVVGAPVRTISALNVTALTPSIPSAGIWSLPAKGTQGPIINSFGLCLDYNATVQVCDGSSTQQWQYFVAGKNGLVTIGTNLGLQGGTVAQVAKFPASSDWYLHTSFLSTVAPVTITAPAGALNADGPSLSGTAQPNSLVVLTVGGVEVGRTTSDAEGNWTAAVSLPVGDATVTAEAMGMSASADVTVAAPVADVTITAPAGALSTVGAELSGTAEPNAEVVLTVDGVEVGKTTADADGNWTASVVIPEGDATVVATAAGKSDSVDVQVVAPVADVTITAPAGTLSTEGATLSGTAQPNAEVVLTVDGVEVGKTTADADGNWTAAVVIPEGDATVVATAAGKSGSVEVTVEAPAAVIADVVITAPAGALSTEGATLSGTAQPNSEVVLTVNGVEVGKTTADADGNWTASVTIPEGDATVVATAAGKSDSVDVQVVAPIADVTITAPAGALSTEGATLSGTAQPNSEVVLTVDGVEVGKTTADADGNWTAPVTIPEGDATVVATAAGKTASVDVTVEAPAAVIDFAVTSPAPSETITADNVTFVGTAPAGTVVEVQDADGNVLGTATADDEGNWSVNVPLVEGPQDFKVVAEGETIVVSVTGNAAAPVSPVINGAVALGALVAAAGIGFTAKRRRLAVDAA